MTRYTQVKKLGSPDELRSHLESIGASLPVDDTVDPEGPLASSVQFADGSAGDFTIPNRFAVLPMEGWDGTAHGQPTDLVRRRWERFGSSGCGLVWGEATAVVPEGRANPNQLVVNEDTVDGLTELRGLLTPGQVTGLQLTHSGRWSRPGGDPNPRPAQRHPVLDQRTSTPGELMSDDDLDALAESFIRAAALAERAGFDFVDVKCCHGYLLHELLGARHREGPFGGDFEHRTSFFRRVVSGIRETVPGIAVAVRLSAFDFVPYRTGADGTGVPEDERGLPRPFGGDESGLGIDLEETHRFLELVAELGVGLVCTTAGSPYYNPHIQRPAYFPPSDGYQPPEDPLVGVARQVAATAELKREHPGLTFVGSGYSYVQDWLAHVGQAVVAADDVDVVGLGRMILSYPQLAADTLAGKPFDRRLVCRTFSDCTTAPRNGLVSGCYPLDDLYKEMPQRVTLAKAKRAMRQAKR